MCAVSNPTTINISLVDISFQVLTAVATQTVALWSLTCVMLHEQFNEYKFSGFDSSGYSDCGLVVCDTVSCCMNSLMNISFQVLKAVATQTVALWSLTCVMLHEQFNEYKFSGFDRSGYSAVTLWVVTLCCTACEQQCFR
jgi:hypothetical protein